MDAAQLFRKIALLFAAALLLAGAANAADIQTDKDTVTFSVPVLPQTINVSMSDSSTQAITINNASGWFTVSTSSPTTPATLTVTKTADCTVTQAGCTTTFTVSAGGSSKNINVVNTTTPGGGTSGILTSSLSPINLNAVFPNFTTQTIQISSSSTIPTNVSAAVTQGNTWLTIQSQSNTSIVQGSPVSLVVYAYSAGLTNNQSYSGQITVTPGNGTSALTIPVNFTVGNSATTGTLSPSQSPIAFSYPNGTVITTISVTSLNTVQYNASATSTGGWLQVNFNSTTTGTSNSGSNLYITANTNVVQFLAAGTYQGAVTLTNALNASDITNIPVTLVVNGGGSGGSGSGGVVAGPSSLTFNYQIGTGAPPYQEVIVPATGTYTIQTSGTPLSISTTSLTGPGSFLVLPAVAGLNVGASTGTITITSNTGFLQTINVTVNVTTSPVLQAFVNGATGDYTCSTTVGCNPASVQVRASDNSTQTIAVTSSQAWVTIEGADTTTPGNFTLRVNTAGLSTGMNTANVTVSGGTATQVVIPVAVQVGTGSGGGGGNTGPLTLGSSSMSFNSISSQTLSVNASTTTQFTVSLAATGCSWLQVNPSGTLSTPQNLTVSAISTPSTSTTCNINLTSNGVTQTVAATFNVGGGGGGSTGSINVDKTTLAFATTTGTNPATQTISVTGANGSTGIGFTVAVESSSGWLSATPTSGSTPNTVTVSANVAGLGTGVHAGIVRITANGGNQYAIQVTLTITAPTSVSATPTTLTYTYVAGNPNPAAQKIDVTGTGANLPFSATVQPGATWLTVSPASGTAPASINAQVDPSTLAPGSYSGTIIVAGTGNATGSTTITVNLTVTAPLPTIARVTNAASFNTGSLAAGEIITLFGTAMAPSTLQAASPTNGQYPTTLGGVTVTVGGYPAPLIYVRNDQIAAIVPYEVNRPFLANLTVLVRYLGQSSNGVTVPQVGAAPGIFTIGSGTGQGAILNANLTQNSASNPANKGDVIVLYVTGEGVTSPAGVTGQVTPNTTPYRQPVSGNVTVTIDGLPATVQFYGEAPGLVAGVMQINAVVPQGAGSGSVPVVVRVGDAASQLTAQSIGAVTVAVR